MRPEEKPGRRKLLILCHDDPLGGVVVLVGVAKLIEDIYLWNLSETAVMAFLSAITIWSVGLLADMIARLQMQPPWRPKD